MLADKMNKVVEGIDELKKVFMRQCTIDMLTSMNDEGLIAMKKCLELMDSSMDLAIEEARVMDEINAKLDKLLEMKEKGSN